MFENPVMPEWLLAILTASVLWGFADILCDICIGEDEEEGDFEYEMVDVEHEGGAGNSVEASGEAKSAPAAVAPGAPAKVADDSSDEESSVNGDGGAGSVGGDGAKSTKSEEEEEEGASLDGVGDSAIAGMTTMSIMYLLALRRVNFGGHVWAPPASSDELGTSEALVEFIWSPFDLEWYLAVVSGAIMFSHYMFLLMAFDTAPSTVINPLVQVAGTWMLLGSAVPAWLLGSKFITPLDLFCYLVIWVGGLLPEVKGNIRFMFTRRFWRQAVIKNIIMSEITVGLYDLIMTYCLRMSGRKDKYREYSTTDLEAEFFFIAWCGFSLTFCLLFALVPWLRQKFLDLRKIPRNIVMLSSFGQALTILGYYCSQYGFSMYYQASIVHACEASLSQFTTLVFVIIAYKCFGIGRETAVEDLGIKIASCLIVSFGLFLLAYSEEEDPLPAVQGPPIGADDLLDALDIDGSLGLGLLPQHARALIL